MILPVYLYGNPVLRKVAEDITPDYPKLGELIDDMFQTMYKADGVGLAAPQVGLAIRLFVIDGSPLVKDHPELADFKKAFINAQIIEYDGETVRCEEGCLSLPDIREEVDRKDRIRIQYRNEKFELKDEVYEGFGARIIQHEYDHIEGKMFVDHLSPLKKRFIKGKLNAISSGRIDPGYKNRVAGK